MANRLFGIGGLLGPPAPGMSGMMNPLAQMGAVMASNNPAGAMAAMGNMNQRGQALYQGLLQQAMQQRALQQYRQQMLEQAAEGLDLRRLNLAAKLSQPTGTTLEQNLIAAGLEPGTPEYQQAALDYVNKPTAPTVNVGTGTIPTGFVRQETPEGGTELVPERGSEVDVKRRQGIQALEGMLTDITELEGLVQQHGTENPLSTAGKRMETLRNRIIGNMPTFRETGVLQEGEIARLEQEFPDATGWVTPGSQVLPKITGFKEEISRKLSSKRSAFGQGATDTGGWSIKARGQ